MVVEVCRVTPVFFILNFNTDVYFGEFWLFSFVPKKGER